MTDVIIPHVVHQDTCAGGGHAAPGLAACLGLPPPRLCPHGAVVCSLQQPAGHALHGDTGSSSMSGMTIMYLLMSAFDSSPWLKLIFRRRNGARRHDGDAVGNSSQSMLS